jgi:hypothetical protein
MVVLVVAITSLAAVIVAARGGIAGLGAALGTMLEAVGATVLFFVANLALGVTLILATRRLTPFYPTLYEVSDVALLVLSSLQALALTLWRRSR